MGTDKASLSYRGRTLVQHMRALAARSGAAPVLVSGGREADLQDAVAFTGPAAGLCALARHVASAGGPGRWLVLPVDMPLLGPELLRRLVVAQARAAVYAGRPLPFALTVDAGAGAVLERVQARLAAGESISLRQVLDLLGAAALAVHPGELDQLAGANTPAEWERLTASAGSDPLDSKGK
jgi:molybdenum cofactor guanylyltransferase